MSEYDTGGRYDSAPRFEDASERQQGFTEATIGILQLWGAYKEIYKDPAKVYEAMDIFLLASAARMTGSSVEDCNTILRVAHEANGLS